MPAKKPETAAKPAKKKMIEFEIVKNLGILSSGKAGWNRELNIVRWNGGRAKLDIRDWSPEHDKMGKGITLTGEEMEIILSIMEDTGAYVADELNG